VEAEGKPVEMDCFLSRRDEYYDGVQYSGIPLFTFAYL
jgi:hypothetical protein